MSAWEKRWLTRDQRVQTWKSSEHSEEKDTVLNFKEDERYFNTLIMLATK